MTNTPETTDNFTPAPVADKRPSRRLWWLAGAGIVLAVGLGAAALGVSIADASEDDDRDDETSLVSDTAAPSTTRDDSDDALITDSERADASAAALSEVGDGTVTDVDRSDDLDHAWEVEVTFADGRDVDVELDENYSIVRVDEDN